MWRRAACAAARNPLPPLGHSYTCGRGTQARNRLPPPGHSYTCGRGTLQACVWRSWSHAGDRQWGARGQASNAAGAKAENDPYKVLGLDRKASAEDVKAAYRRLALKWHPDRNRDNQVEAEEQFKRVSKAYSLLSDPQQREDFDRFGFDPQSFSSRAGPGARPWTEEEAQMIFRQMFGDKPLHEIIREVEMSFDQHQKQMQQKELELRDKAQQLRREADEMQMRAHLAAQTQHHRREAQQMQQLAFQKAHEADRAEQELQASVLQHTVERMQQSSVRRRLQSLDPTERALNGVRLGFAWFVSLTAYFFWGWSILGSVFAYIIASNCARLTFVLLRALRGVKRP